MPTRLTLRAQQLDNLKVMVALGPEALERLAVRLRDLPGSSFTAAHLREAISEVLPDREDDCDAILRQMMSLYALRRQSELGPAEVIEGLQYGITHAPEERRWSAEQIGAWERVIPQLEELLSLDTVWLVAKAWDLTYEYANLFHNARIITDIRPLFTQDASEVKASVVSFILRLYYDSRDANHSLTIAMDEADVTSIKEQCERALRKAEIARERMALAGIPTIIAGANGDEPT